MSPPSRARRARSEQRPITMLEDAQLHTEVVRIYAVELQTIDRTAVRVGCSPATVHRILVATHTPRRRRGSGKWDNPRIRGEVLQLRHREGLTTQNIARKIGCSAATVGRMLSNAQRPHRACPARPAQRRRRRAISDFVAPFRHLQRLTPPAAPTITSPVQRAVCLPPNDRSGSRVNGAARSAADTDDIDLEKGKRVTNFEVGEQQQSPLSVVVTGVAGFVASHLVERLLNDGFAVVGIDRRDPDNDRLAKLNMDGFAGHPRFKRVQADLADADLDSLLAGAACVFHLAGIPGVRPSWTTFGDYLTANVLATERLLKACVRGGVPKLVYASSSSVYGEVAGPSREVDATQPLSPYGVSKLAGEQLCLAYAKRPGSALSVSALRYFTVYGPRQRPDMAIGRILAAAITGYQYTLFGDGAQRRDFTYIDDVVTATIAASKLTLPAAVMNVGGGSSVSMIDVIGAAREVTGNPVPLTATASLAGDVPATAADLTLAHLLTGYQPHTDLVSGMRRHADWLRQLPSDLMRLYVPAPLMIEEEVPAC